MATVALGLAFGPIGAVVGSIIDQRFLFAPSGTSGPRLDSLPVGSSSEGSPIYFTIGDRVGSVPGTVIWLSPLVEHKSSQGGKGGPKVDTFEYSVDLAVDFGEGPVDGIQQLFANGNLIYDDQPDIDYTSTHISGTVINEVHYSYGDSTVETTRRYFEMSSPNGDVDLSKFKSGKDMTLAGFSNALNNGTFRCVSSSIDATTGISKCKVRNDVAVTASTGPTVTLHQTLPKFDPSKLSSVTFYPGDETQLGDPTIEAWLGTGNAPGFRGITYLLLGGFFLTDYGNAVPQFTAIVRERTSPATVGQAITKIMQRAGRSTDEFDTSALTDTIKGYYIRGPVEIADQLKPLLIAYKVLTQEDQGVIRFFKRKDAEEVTIPTALLPAEEPGSDGPHPMRFKDDTPAKLPSRVEVKYTEPRNDYQDGSRTARKPIIYVENIQSLDLRGLALSAAEADEIAKTTLFTAWANAKGGKPFTLPPSYMRVVESDLAVITVAGRTFRFLVLRASRGANGLLEYEGANEYASTLDADGTGDDPEPLSVGYVPPPYEMLFAILDIPPMRTDDLDAPSIYVASCAYDYYVNFVGAALYASIDAGATFTNILNIATETTMGRCSTTLGNGALGYWDNVRTVTVVLNEGTLESATEDEVFAGKNWAMVGLEIIAFKTATLTAPLTYQLSGLLRGLRSTDDRMTGHIANEPFILLSSTNMYRKVIEAGQINLTEIFKCVPPGGVLAEATPTTTMVKAINLQPFSPCQVTGARNAGNDLTINWVRRTRAPFRLLGGTFAPLAEDVEKYEIDILNAAETVVKRTLTVTGATSTTYLATDQTTDGYTPGNAIHMKLYMISSTVGRSKARLAVI